MNEQHASNKEAREALAKVKTSQQATMNKFKPSVIISALASLCYGAIVFGYGMMEHENNWALMMLIGAIGFVIAVLIYRESYKLAGIKISLFPRSQASKTMHVYAGLAFFLCVFPSRILRTEFGFEYAPHVCASACVILFFYLQRVYPTGEVESVGSDNG